MRKLILLFLTLNFSLVLAAQELIDGTTGRSDICELHKIHMHKVKVPIVYGLPLSVTKEEKKYFEAKEKLFPNANAGKIQGGCLPSSQEKANVYVCPRCEKERKRWIKAKESIIGEKHD